MYFFLIINRVLRLLSSLTFKTKNSSYPETSFSMNTCFPTLLTRNLPMIHHHHIPHDYPIEDYLNTSPHNNSLIPNNVNPISPPLPSSQPDTTYDHLNTNINDPPPQVKKSNKLTKTLTYL